MPHRYTLFLAASLLLGLSACPMVEPTDRIPLPSYKPLLMARSQLEQAVAVLPPRELHNTGKIYFRDPYLLINEQYEGLHIIDNHDPTHPRPVAFLRIPGNVDVTMLGSLLYADSGSDLLTFDMRDMPNPTLRHRLREAVPELPMPQSGLVPDQYQAANRPADAVVIGWQKL
ncbi:LVIVD repeat-containing protein [Hymenobacter rubripertinctus]|uniref:Uncharacterized protein n=1 Tax=Hymenobacter rubripertinctus TaxID=2029981 RepID=A0A418QP94_9BACT|nr:hypothetical protein [Hymenobacter rubripertinctus]RIY06931.1 hypothetical protein D0T11_17575 [Hymenobacter rubripertinctus]